MFAARRLYSGAPRAVPASTYRSFQSSARAFVKVGDAIPDVELMEDSPGNKVKIAQELKSGKGLIIGVPAAFSKACSCQMPSSVILYIRNHIATLSSV